MRLSSFTEHQKVPRFCHFREHLGVSGSFLAGYIGMRFAVFCAKKPVFAKKDNISLFEATLGNLG
jgi:hypothetical protein